MATALQSNDDLNCCLCKTIFKIPKILPCGHSFCRDCLQRYTSGKMLLFPCPVCKQYVIIPLSGIDKFPTNISLNTLTLKPKHECPNHSEKDVEYYCQTCELGLCSKCILKDHNDHKTLDLELKSTRKQILQELSNSEQFIKNKITNLKTTLTALVETSTKLKMYCDEACTKISEQKENSIKELTENCEKRQKEVRDNFNKNKSKLTETRQKVMTQIENIKTDFDTSHCPTATEEPSLTLIYSLNKLQDLQKLCKNMKTDIPPVTYVEWGEGSVQVCDILGSTVTKPLYKSSEGSGPISTVTKTLYQSREGSVFKFNYKDIKDGVWYNSKDKCTCHSLVWSCVVCRGSYNTFSSDKCLYVCIELLEEDNPQVESCDLKYTLTILNKDDDKNVSQTTTERLFTYFGLWSGMINIPLDKLTEPQDGFIDIEGHFFVRFDLLQVLDSKDKC